MKEVKPDEIYHLAAQSHVRVSFDVPGYTCQTDAFGTLNVLEAMRKHAPNAKFYNAATSELFGKAIEIPQKETTPFNPRSPYGVAKLYAFHITKNYRESYNLFAVNGILFNHESERRGSTFVTKKITEGLVKYLKNGTPFYLGNINAKRDWGYAPDFVEGMWMMLQQNEPEDFILATGETHTIKEFISECLKYFKGPVLWDFDEKGRDILWDPLKNKLIIGIDEIYYRPSEVDILLGDASKAKEKLGWESKVKFNELVKRMMQNELK
jgi:GDPmannose 4,6-dehydratase